MLTSLVRFAIEKKLRDAKRQEKKRAARQQSGINTSESIATARSLHRRKAVEDRTFSKKFSALQDLKAKRERKQGL